jgi:hypothetical protein
MNSDEINLMPDMANLVNDEEGFDDDIQVPPLDRPLTPGVNESPLSMLGALSNKPMTA